MRWKTYVISSSNPGNYIVCYQCSFRPYCHSVFTKIKGGADGKRRIEVPFKIDGNTDDGWDYHTCECDTDLSDICIGLSEDHTDLICDRGLWNRGIFR